MADDASAAVSPELDIPAIPAEAQPVDEPTTPEDDLAANSEEITEGAATEPTDEFDDFEHDGKAYKVPKALVPHLMRDKDYTQKRQADADKARALEAREAEIEARSKATDDELDARAQLKHVTSEIARLEKFDWQAYQQARRSDPMRADEAWNYKQHLAAQKAGLEGKVSHAQKLRTEAAQSALTKRIQDTLAEAPKIIPGWKPETANKTIGELVEFAASVGIPEQVVKDNWSPQLLTLLHRARVGDQLLKKQVSAPKPPPPAPLTTVTGGRSAGSVNLAETDDMEAYVAARRKGVGGAPLR